MASAILAARAVVCPNRRGRIAALLVKAARWLCYGLFALSLPVLFLSSAFRWSAMDVAAYDSEHQKLNVPEALRTSPQQTHLVSLAVIDYFSSSQNDLPVLLAQRGADPAFFSQRDLLHLVDVKGLLQMLFQANTLTAVTAGVLLLAVMLLSPRRRVRAGVRALFIAGLFTMLVLIVAAVLALTDFEAIFLQFHLVAFANDLWILDPATDRLIVMFPPAFFSDLLVGAAITTMAIAAGLSLLSGGYLWWRRRAERG